MSKKNDRLVCFLKAMWNDLDGLEDQNEHDTKVWTQGYKDCLSEVIAALEEKP